MIVATRKPAAAIRGFTLAEMLIVLTVIATLATMVSFRLTATSRQSADTLTRVSLRQLRQAILADYRDDMFEQLPYPQDPARAPHPQLHYLYVNPASYVTGLPTDWDYDPVSGRGWSGPYLTQAAPYVVDLSRGFTPAYGEAGDDAPLDAWGNPIVLQQPMVLGAVYSATNLQSARLVSAGPNGVINTPENVATPSLNQQADDLILFLRPQ